MLQTISLVGTVSAGSTAVIASKAINYPFTIKKLIANFALGDGRTNQISFYLSPDAAEPTSGTPSGTNLLSFLSDTPYLVGDDDKKDIPAEIQQTDWPSWIKVYANNTDGFDHTIDCQIIIERPDNG